MKRDKETENRLIQMALDYFYTNPIDDATLINLWDWCGNSVYPSPLPSELDEEIIHYYCDVWGGTATGRKSANLFMRALRKAVEKLKFISYFGAKLAIPEKDYDEYEKDIERLNDAAGTEDFFTIRKEIQRKWWNNDDLTEKQKNAC